MSRSYKKVSVSKMKNNRYFKRLVHRKNRALEKQYVFLSSRQYTYQVNPWRICDYTYVQFAFPLKYDTPTYWTVKYRSRDWLLERQEWYRKGLRK